MDLHDGKKSFVTSITRPQKKTIYWKHIMSSLILPGAADDIVQMYKFLSAQIRITEANIIFCVKIPLASLDRYF